MDIKLELLRNYVSSFVINHINDFELDADKIANTVAIVALGEIQKIISDENISDFDAVEKIVNVFEKYNLSFGSRHDF